MEYLLYIIILVSFLVFKVVLKGRFKLYKRVILKLMFSKNNLIIINIKLKSIILKVSCYEPTGVAPRRPI